MEISDLIATEQVIPNFKVSSKKQALQELARRAEAVTGLQERVIFDTLLEREKLGTTGIGGGIAIPHAKLPNLERPYGLFARIAPAIDFDSVDEGPVDLIFLLLAPESAGADHLKALARISRLLRDTTVCENLRQSEDRDAMFALLTHAETSRAA